MIGSGGKSLMFYFISLSGLIYILSSWSYKREGLVGRKTSPVPTAPAELAQCLVLIRRFGEVKKMITDSADKMQKLAVLSSV